MSWVFEYKGISGRLSPRLIFRDHVGSTCGSSSTSYCWNGSVGLNRNTCFCTWKCGSLRFTEYFYPSAGGSIEKEIKKQRIISHGKYYFQKAPFVRALIRSIHRESTSVEILNSPRDKKRRNALPVAGRGGRRSARYSTPDLSHEREGPGEVERK